jgi:hypothetical protein
MQHIFHLTFQNHLGLKRKYLYSFQDADTKANTFDILQQLIERTREAKQNWKDTAVMSSASRQLADQISIRVLQSSLIAKGDELKASGSRKRKKDIPGGTPSRRPSNPASINQETLPLARNPAIRQEFMQGTGNNDVEKLATITNAPPSDTGSHTGKDIVLICRQNSLLPVVLGFLRYGLPTEVIETVADAGQGQGYGIHTAV